METVLEEWKLKCKNAGDILPPKLIDEIRCYFPGGLLWVPKTGDLNLERDKLVMRLIEEKVPVKEVAAIAQISPRQVYRIVKKCTSEKE